MAKSLNLRFAAKIPIDPEFEHPPGAAFIRWLSSELSSQGWNSSEFDNWRDSGWFITCNKPEAELEISFARISGDDWMLQISPRPAGCLAFLAKPRANGQAIYDLALAVHRCVAQRNYIATPLLWMWDGYPEPEKAATEPRPPTIDSLS